jgi:putative FmdB family regulatory protein
MPTYTYACKQCDHRFDQRQSFADPALTVCPRCAGRLRKVLNSVGVVFKGSGFYRTDSRAGGKSGTASLASDSRATSNDKKTAAESAPNAAGGKSETTKTPVAAGAR